MKRGLVMADVSALILALLFLVAAEAPAARAQMAPQGQFPQICAEFPKVNDEARKRAEAVEAAMKAKVDRKQVCVLMTSFVAAETNVIKFLEQNKTWCGIPPEAITAAKTSHEKSTKFREAACAEAPPQRKEPTLSDAIKTPTIDSATNTKTGHGGTFDTLTGNPLAR